MNQPRPQGEHKPELIKSYSELLFEATELRNMVTSNEVDTVLDRTFDFLPGRFVAIPQSLQEVGFHPQDITTSIRYGTMPQPSPLLDLPDKADLYIKIQSPQATARITYHIEDEQWIARYRPAKVTTPPADALTRQLHTNFMQRRYPDIPLQTTEINALLLSLALPQTQWSDETLTLANPHDASFVQHIEDLLSQQADSEKMASVYHFRSNNAVSFTTHLSAERETFEVQYPDKRTKGLQLLAQSSTASNGLTVNFKMRAPDFDDTGRSFMPTAEDLHYLLGIIRKEIRGVHHESTPILSTATFENAEANPSDDPASARRIHRFAPTYEDETIAKLDFDSPPEATELGVSDN